MKRSARIAAAALAVAAAGALLADLDGSYVLPLDHPAIRYATSPVRDPVAQLIERIETGRVKLAYDAAYGYLPALLRELGVPVSSQVLVFSKTSFQAPKIGPRTPRAIYFNDKVSVGFVRTGDVLELASVDPEQGVIFYSLDQQKAEKPGVRRHINECINCHATGASLGVPGLVVRSVYTDAGGTPLMQAGDFVTDHRSPFEQRWGGWYATGTHGKQQFHMGNVTVQDLKRPTELDTRAGANIEDLKYRFDKEAYLSPHSDLAALIVLEHQTRMTNLITRVGFETRMALHDQALLHPGSELTESTRRRIENATEVLVTYMLFGDEAKLREPVRGTSGFAEEFSKQGPRDRRGRSLREIDLESRLMRYPCSYMIYSEAFDALPAQALDRVYRRVWEVLTGRDQSKMFARLTAEDRRAILEILRDTKPDLPSYYKN
jgi:hypothetical protein